MITERVRQCSDTKFHHRASLILPKLKDIWCLLYRCSRKDFLKIIVEENLSFSVMPQVQLSNIIFIEIRGNMIFLRNIKG